MPTSYEASSLSLVISCGQTHLLPRGSDPVLSCEKPYGWIQHLSPSSTVAFQEAIGDLYLLMIILIDDLIFLRLSPEAVKATASARRGSLIFVFWISTSPWILSD